MPPIKKTIQITDDASKLNAVMDTVIDGLIIIDNIGTIHSFNKSAERIFGYVPDEVLGHNVKKLMPAPYKAEHDQYLSTYRETGKRHIIGVGRSVEARRKNGEVFPIELGVSEMEISGEQMFVGTLRDISERKKAEEDLLQANTELEEFAYRTSHDLRSPLLSSVGLLGLIKTAIQEDNKEFALEGLDKVSESLVNLEHLVESILALSKAKNEQESNVKIDITEIIEQAILKLNHMDHYDRVAFEYNIQARHICTKESRIRLIIENLISNAIKYQDLNKQDPTVFIEAKSTDSQFTLSVKDNGLGIPQDSQKELFKMFRRLHPKVSYGSGLGLYMMKKSVELLHGEIHYTPLSNGSQFTITIPLKAKP
ncbi:MAG: sensor histidine kinase [Alcanivorax sp.]